MNMAASFSDVLVSHRFYELPIDIPRYPWISIDIHCYPMLYLRVMICPNAGNALRAYWKPS